MSNKENNCFDVGICINRSESKLLSDESFLKEEKSSPAGKNHIDVSKLRCEDGEQGQGATF